MASFGITFSFVIVIRCGSKSCGRYAPDDAMMAITEMMGALQTPPDARPFAPLAWNRVKLIRTLMNAGPNYIV